MLLFCLSACLRACALLLLALVRLVDQSVTFQLLTDNDLHRDIFLTPNIDGNYEYAVIIIRGIKTDGEFQSHSCVHLDCPEDLRLLVRRATVRNIGEMKK